MDYTAIINTAINYLYIAFAIMAVLVFTTNIIVEVIKGLFPKVPTSYVTVVVAILTSVVALLIAAAVLAISVMWYYAVGAVVMGIFVAYAAMFGFDKFKEAWEKIKLYRKKEQDQVAVGQNDTYKAVNGFGDTGEPLNGTVE